MVLPPRIQNNAVLHFKCEFEYKLQFVKSLSTKVILIFFHPFLFAFVWGKAQGGEVGLRLPPTSKYELCFTRLHIDLCFLQ
jgi:hypothetical protein